MTDRRPVDNSADNVEKVGRKVGGSRLPDGRVAPGRGPAKGAPNAGRPRLAVKALAAQAIEQHDLVGVVAKIAAGQIGETLRDRNGNELQVFATKPSERLAATKLLLAYAEGMPTQQVEVAGQGLQVVINHAPKLDK